jgi:hypothetical protein
MTDKQQGKAPDPKMDAATLYREDIFTDRKVGTIRQLTPVKPDGSPDPARPVLYVGEAQILTPMGALPITFELPAKTLREAADKFGPATKEALDRTMQELQEMRRQASSSIVIPERGAGPIGPGGLPGGGKIKLP